MPFVKGKSGNPGGRPKLDPEVKNLIEKFTPDAINTLAEVMKNKKGQAGARVTAALGILRKTVPDLSAQQIEAEWKNYVARLPAPAANTADWLASIGKTPNGGADSAGDSGGDGADEGEGSSQEVH